MVDKYPTNERRESQYGEVEPILNAASGVVMA